MYIEELKRHYNNNKMYEKIEASKEEIQHITDSTWLEVTKKCKTPEKKARKLMIAAEKKLYNKQYWSRHWSLVILTKAAHNYILLKKQQQHMYNNRGCSNVKFEALEDENWESARRKLDKIGMKFLSIMHQIFDKMDELNQQSHNL